MKDGISEWAKLAEEAEAKKNWRDATDFYAQAATDALGYDIRDTYIAKRNECDRKACKLEQSEWVPTANQAWMGVDTKDD